MPYKTFAKQIIKEMMDQLGEGKPIRGRKPIKKKKRKELQGSISRKEAEKKFKEMKNPEDWKNPDYYEKKAGGGIYTKKSRAHGGKVDNSGQQMVAKQYGGKVK